MKGEVEDTGQAAVRMVRALGRRIGSGNPEDLRLLREVARAVRPAMADAVAGLRAQGLPDQAIGDALAITRQAVGQRWPSRDNGNTVLP